MPLLAIISVVLALIVTPLIARVMKAIGLVDRADSARKIHAGAVPRGGGIAVVISYIVTLALSGRTMPAVWSILPAAGLIFAIGILDDVLDLNPWQKLMGQTVAAGLACASGLLNATGASWWMIPVAMIWLLACCNGFNLIDGMDGLAAGAGIFAAIAIAVSAMLAGNTDLAAAAWPLAGALAGFLCFNFSPAKIFLGDSGSLVIGFLLGCFGILGLERPATPMGLRVPLIALALPLADAALTVARRVLSGRSVFVADRGHVHHRLLERVRNPRKAALLLYGFCGFAAVASVAASPAGNAVVSVLLTAALCVGAVAAAWSLRLIAPAQRLDRDQIRPGIIRVISFTRFLL